MDNADVVRSFAVEERIPLAGTTPVGPVEPEGSRLLDWLRRGLAGDLTYLARTADLRGNPASPRLLRGGAMGAVVLGLPYDRIHSAGEDRPAAGLPEFPATAGAASASPPDPPPAASGKALGGRPPVPRKPRGGEGNGCYDRSLPAGADATGPVAGYARGRDYHAVFRDLLRRLAARLRAADPGVVVRPFCDTAPVMDRALAVRAGLGWQGRNAMVIHPEHGSTFVIGGLLVNRLLPAAEAVEPRCGHCRLCMDACPTRALSAEGVLDARRCLSTWTTRGRRPPPGLPDGPYSLGCDVCQDVCPFNRGPGPVRHAGFRVRDHRRPRSP